MNSIETVIRKYISLGKPNSRGWFPTLCKVCNDHGHKGMRAAFRFDDNSCSYNCFNCGISDTFNVHSNTMHDKMANILSSFGIPEIEWQKIIFNNLGKEQTNTSIPTITDINPTPISLLPFFYPLIDDPDDDWCQYSIEYLANRQIDWKTHPFYCVKHTDHKTNKRWYGRLIIPIFDQTNQLVFYQGRDLTDMHIKKYLQPSVDRNNILYGYNNILTYSSEPIYVVEGWFDAILLNGVAVFGNKMSNNQILWLNKSNRPKVIIPDKYGSGKTLAEQGLKLGWKVALPDTGDCKDMNDAIVKYGLLYVLRSLEYNTFEGTIAQTQLNIYCKK